MSFRTFIIVSLLALATIEYFALKYEKGPIEQVLRQKTIEVFADNPTEISVDQVSFDGRDLTIKGEVSTPAEKRRIEGLLLSVWDVRQVNNQLWVSEAEEIQITDLAEDSASDSSQNSTYAVSDSLFALSASFRLEHIDEVIMLQGTFSDSVMQGRVVDVVKSSFPGIDVDPQIRVDTTIVRPLWYPSLMAIVPTVGLVTKPELSVSNDGMAFNLSGEVFGDVQREVITADALNALGDSLSLNASLVLAASESSEEDVRVATLRARIQTLLATTKVQFQINTADLMLESMQVLDEIAVLLNEAPDIQVEIQGHTDNTGSNAVNTALSQVRAASVRSYLIRKGVDGARLTAVGYGPARPIATNFTYEGRVTNRRVEFSLKGGS